jgi:hypothetical protein
MTFLPAPITGDFTVICGLRFVPRIIPRFMLTTVGISRSTGSRIIIGVMIPVVTTTMVVSAFTSIIARYIVLAMGVSRRVAPFGLLHESHHSAWPSGVISITIITRSFGVVMRRTTLSFLLIQVEGLRGTFHCLRFFEYYIK